MRIAYLSYYFFTFTFLGIVAIVDFTFNVPLILKCKWNKIFIDDDPFNFRIELAPLFSAVPLTIVWGFVPLPKYFYSIITEYLMFILLFTSGTQTLLITIIKKIIFLRNKSRNRKSESISIKYCLSPEIIDLFIKFCEYEWSVENISFKLDIVKYKNLKSKSERSVMADIIKTKYLIIDVSELEINAPQKTLIEICKKIDNGNIENDLFHPIEKVVDVNLGDTISRFQFSSMYYNYLSNIKYREKVLGL